MPASPAFCAPLPARSALAPAPRGIHLLCTAAPRPLAGPPRRAAVRAAATGLTREEFYEGLKERKKTHDPSKRIEDPILEENEKNPISPTENSWVILYRADLPLWNHSLLELGIAPPLQLETLHVVTSDIEAMISVYPTLYLVESLAADSGAESYATMRRAAPADGGTRGEEAKVLMGFADEADAAFYVKGWGGGTVRGVAREEVVRLAKKLGVDPGIVLEGTLIDPAGARGTAPPAEDASSA